MSAHTMYDSCGYPQPAMDHAEREAQPPPDVFTDPVKTFNDVFAWADREAHTHVMADALLGPETPESKRFAQVADGWQGLAFLTYELVPPLGNACARVSERWRARERLERMTPWGKAVLNISTLGVLTHIIVDCASTFADHGGNAP